MIGGLSAFDRFCADLEREAGATPARQWCERNGNAIHAAYVEMEAGKANLGSQPQSQVSGETARG